jgi:DNA/RNA endonuclease YhcR with UshA esterase domain
MNPRPLIITSLIISIIGIFLLLILTLTIQPVKTKIKDIDSSELNQRIQIQGKIISIRTYKSQNFQIITLNDSTGKIDITLTPINVTKNQTIIVTGRVAEYKNNLQIEAEKISLS